MADKGVGSKVTFWPVGNGDSTTISVNNDVKIQVDLHHMTASEDDKEEYFPVVDHIVEDLPVVDGKPYLSVFALTHPDKDHVKGFGKLLEEATIGELWLTPRVFEDDELSSEAEEYLEEATRRKDLAIANGGDLDAGDRIRIFGYTSVLKEEAFKGFPEELLTLPGQELTLVDGEDLNGEFSAFIHSPFNAEEEQDRNDTSLGMQVTLGESNLRVLLFGDLAHDELRKIIDISRANGNEDRLEWDVLLAPHHCSKSVMYTKDDNDKDVLQQAMMDDLGSFGSDSSYIVSSSKSVPASNEKGDNPPHAIAKERYEEIVVCDFLCTHSDEDKEAVPVVFEKTDDGFQLEGSTATKGEGRSLSESVAMARGSNNPPTNTAGFGSV